MRKIGYLLAVIFGLGVWQSASAADMPTKSPAYKAPVASPYNWTGFYIGIHGGGGWGTSGWVDDPIFGGLDLGSHRTSGGVLGGQIGYNWQAGAWVYGLEGDGSWARLTGRHTDTIFGSDLNTTTNSIFSAAGRFGYAWDRTLLYVKGGAVWAGFDYADNVTVGGVLNGGNSSTRSGWMIGGGLEYALSGPWSVKLEYNYLDFGSKTLPFGGGVGGAFVQTITDRISVAKIGLNYRFGR